MQTCAQIERRRNSSQYPESLQAFDRCLILARVPEQKGVEISRQGIVGLAVQSSIYVLARVVKFALRNVRLGATDQGS